MITLASLALALPVVADARVEERRVQTCDLTLAAQAPLRVEDQASLAGALVESPTLVTLPNGLKAVQFSVHYAKRLNASGRILRFRYTVEWSDDCGRRLVHGANVTDGLALSRGQHHTVQSNALHRDAARAVLRTYVETD